MNAVRSAVLDAEIEPRTLCHPVHGGRHPSIRKVLGETAWLRLPEAVRARFADEVLHAEYVGSFDIVRASLPGKLLALTCRLIGTPIAPYTGAHVPAVVRVFANANGGMVWERTYRFSARRSCVVSSTKQIDDSGGFVEALPVGLRMPLTVYERNGILHFVSRGYFLHWLGMRIRLASWLPPGATHVEHIDEGDGWFRFTMSVTHPWLGEVYFQTGRFRSASEA